MAHVSSIPGKDAFLAPLRHYAPPPLVRSALDLLPERYQVLVREPLPTYDGGGAKACLARDRDAPDALLYALIFDIDVPLRPKHFEVLKRFHHPHLVNLHAAGVAFIPALSAMRYVAVLDQPIGKRLSELLSDKAHNPVPESMLKGLLRPLVEILVAFKGLGISHNRIHLSSIYLHSKGVMLGECLSEPSGFSQDALFETPERALVAPSAKADFDIGADCYALSVVALHLALGFQPFARADKARLVQDMLAKGPYHALALPWNFSDEMDDLFRAMLNESRQEYWTPEAFLSWLGGKRFNLILPSQPRETTRGLEVQGAFYFNRKAAAQALFVDWDEGRGFLFDNRLVRWLESITTRGDVAQAVSRLSARNVGNTARGERQNNELFARILMVMDPGGPMRYVHFSLAAPGAGVFLSQIMLRGTGAQLQILAQIFEMNLPVFWLEQHPAKPPLALASALQNIRPLLRSTALGFGMERVLYDLNPMLACQSPLVKPYAVFRLEELLPALDHAAQAAALQQDYMDRHIAAFIASKMRLDKEVRLARLRHLPHLAEAPSLIAFAFLLQVEAATKPQRLVGLTLWATAQLAPMLLHLHRRNVRERAVKEMQHAAASGSISQLADMLLSPHLFLQDDKDFLAQRRIYHARQRRIHTLRSVAFLMQRSRVVGKKLAQIIAYCICGDMMYVTCKAYFHWPSLFGG